MTEYWVTWAIDVDADSPREAAEKARAHQVRPGSTATVFDVYDGQVFVEHVDLDEPTPGTEGQPT